MRPSPSQSRRAKLDAAASDQPSIRVVLAISALAVSPPTSISIAVPPSQLSSRSREGREPDSAHVATGSHIDAIPYSRKYGGVVGVLGAIEAIDVLKRSEFTPIRSLEVVMFTSEEPTRFGISCLGSRLMAGSEELEKALKITVDSQNISFVDAVRSAGYMKDQDDFADTRLEKGSYSAFVELHIEKGPILEAECISIGVVTAIAAPASIKMDFEGSRGHAGAKLMPYRNDAGLVAAELALAVEKLKSNQQDNTFPDSIPYSSDDIEEGEVIGIITLEDVLEELLQEEIVDETYESVDVHKRIRVAAVVATSSVARAL